MKFILSRKGFDSSYGGIASPIMPDGTLLSLPIPEAPDLKDNNGVTYSDLRWNDKSYYEIIKTLNPKTKIPDNSQAHLDPDLRQNIKLRPDTWKAAFGQCGAAATHLLERERIQKNDLFIFFGWFKQRKKLGIPYPENTGDLHVIFGYLQVGNIYTSKNDVPDYLHSHPHYSDKYWKEEKNNVIFEATDKLSFIQNYPGSGCFNFSEKLVLTKKRQSRSKWDLPDFFKKIDITYHNENSWKNEAGYFQSAAIGQEFVFEANNDVLEWFKGLLQTQPHLKM